MISTYSLKKKSIKIYRTCVGYEEQDLQANSRF